MNNVTQGFNLIGICKGVKTQSSGQYTNHDLGVAVQSPDGFGGTTENIYYVSLFGDSLNRIQNQLPQFIGKTVSLAVVVQAKKSERTGNAYQKVFPQQNALLVLLDEFKPLKQAV